MSLGDVPDGLPWWRLSAYVAALPHDSATVQAQLGYRPWTAAEHLLAYAVDALRGANWQRGGKKAGPRPDPILRPGQEPRRNATRTSTVYSVDEMRRMQDAWATGGLDALREVMADGD